MKNREKLVSVIVGSYNSEKTLEKSINSLINQTYENIEILIVDDYSADKSNIILKTLQKKTNKINLYRNSENIGLTRSLNKLIKLSNGELIARHDADDYSDPQRIAKQVSFMEERNLDACTTRANIKDLNKVIPNLSYYLPKRLVIKYKNPFIHGTLLIKKSTLEKINYYDERFYYSQDYKLMSDLIKMKTKIKIMKDTLYLLNMENNISTKYKDKQDYYAECVRKNISPNINFHD